MNAHTVHLSALNLPRVLFAQGALSALAAELSALGIRKPLLVTDQGLVSAGLAARAVSACGDAAVPVVFDQVTENPLFADVDKGAARYAAEGCDGVVAFGGGSVIDTAKMIALLATNPGSVAKYAGVFNAQHGPSAPLIVIPTTAGTGSEASPSAGIHPDASTPSVGMGSRHLIPVLAILDPDLTRSLSPRLTAATGIDALSHCIEGFLSKKDIPLGKSIALDGIARVARYLRRAVADRDDAQARGEMMLAAFAGGASIAMGLGPAHAVAIVCSDQGFHHGLLSGIGLVTTLDATGEKVPEQAAKVATALGVTLGQSLGSAIASLMRELNLPATLAELRYEVRDIETLASAAHRSHFNLFAPVHPSVAEYASMLAHSLETNRNKCI
jgi:4-hydroxybutyrate dehydrogenase